MNAVFRMYEADAEGATVSSTESRDDFRIDGEGAALGYSLSAGELEGHLWLEVFNSSNGNHAMISAADAAKFGRWLLAWSESRRDRAN